MISAPAGSERSAAVEALWREFVGNLSAADLKIPGLCGRVLRDDGAYVIFMTAEQDVLVPAHHHGAQWGVVLEGEMELTIGGDTRSYGRGDTHYIPAGVEHAAILRAGWKAIYVFSVAS